jgi:hypothetical protein
MNFPATVLDEILHTSQCCKGWWAMRFNISLGADTQQRDAASRRVLRAGQRQR